MKLLFPIVIMLGSIISCNPDSRQANDFSQKIIEKENEIKTEVDANESKLQKLLAELNYDSVGKISEMIEGHVHEKTNETDKIPVPPVKEASELKSSAIEYFESTSDFFSNYKQFAQAKSEQEREVIKSRTNDIIKRRAEAVKKFNAIKIKYADKNKIRELK